MDVFRLKYTSDVTPINKEVTKFYDFFFQFDTVLLDFQQRR